MGVARAPTTTMQTISTVGLDIAKSMFQVHGVNDAGQLIIRRQLQRRYVLTFSPKLPPCLFGIEACASSHNWSRQLKALGHRVRLMPPAYVKPYVKRRKNDGTGARQQGGQRCGSLRICLKRMRQFLIARFESEGKSRTYCPVLRQRARHIQGTAIAVDDGSRVGYY